MSKVNYAAIDIGSNAVRLLIKSINPETSEQLFTKELLLRVPLRLGEEVFTQGEIPASKAKKLLRLMKAYRQLMKIYEVDAYRACATSAMRDAANGKEVIETITRKSGIRIDIINGEEEAVWYTIITSNTWRIKTPIISMSTSGEVARKSA